MVSALLIAHPEAFMAVDRFAARRRPSSCADDDFRVIWQSALHRWTPAGYVEPIAGTDVTAEKVQGAHSGAVGSRIAVRRARSVRRRIGAGRGPRQTSIAVATSAKPLRQRQQAVTWQMR